MARKKRSTKSKTAFDTANSLAIKKRGSKGTKTHRVQHTPTADNGTVTTTFLDV